MKLFVPEAESDALPSRRVDAAHSPHAERLLLLSLHNMLRAPDALHVAAALDTEAATPVTYDPRLREAARSQGLFVAPDSAPA